MTTLYQSEFFRFSQCDRYRCFWFTTENKEVNLSFCQLLDLRNKVNAIDLLSHFDLETTNHDLEVICFGNREHLLLLDLHQIIDLKKGIASVFEVMQQVSNSFIEI